MPGASRLTHRIIWAVTLATLAFPAVAPAANGSNPSLLRDIYPGSRGSSSSQSDPQAVLGGRLLFAARDPAHGFELWRSDGTGAGTRLVRDIYPGAKPGGAPTGPGSLHTAGSSVFLAANNGVWGRELWRSDGTSSGTRLVRDICPGGGYGRSATPHFFSDAQGTLYFDANDGTHGNELWRSDGTAAGTQLVRDIYPGSSASDPDPIPLASLGGTFLFFADDGVHGKELWRTDGTPTGTTMVRDIDPGSAGSFLGGPTVKAGGALFFAADDGTHGAELWRTDGTAAGTTMVRDINPGSGGSGALTVADGGANLDGQVYFEAFDGTRSGLWRSDGTAAGTNLVSPVDPLELLAAGGTLFFSGFTPDRGLELWRSDGTEAGTRLVRDIWPGMDPWGRPNESFPQFLTNVRGTVFFAADDGIHGRELWRTDGTAAGTALVGDIRDGALGSDPANLVSVQDTLLFTADDGVHGVEPWKAVP